MDKPDLKAIQDDIRKMVPELAQKHGTFDAVIWKQMFSVALDNMSLFKIENITMYKNY